MSTLSVAETHSSSKELHGGVGVSQKSLKHTQLLIQLGKGPLHENSSRSRERPELGMTVASSLMLSSGTPDLFMLLPKVARSPWVCPGIPGSVDCLERLGQWRISGPHGLIPGLPQGQARGPYGVQWGEEGSMDAVNARRGACLTASSLWILMAP